MTNYDLAIIGGGPAGLTAGIYASRARLKVVLIEKGVPGGQIATTERVENFPGFPEGISGLELATLLEKQAQKFGLEIKNLTEVKTLRPVETGYEIKTSEGTIFSKAVLIASGASPTKLGVKGEKEFTGRGVSYCATCDGAFFSGKKVMVVGGGDSAIEEALYLARIAAEVTVVHRRDQLRATKILQERAFENSKIKFIWNSHLIEIRGEEKVSSVVVKNKLTEEEKELEMDGVFIYIGLQPNSQWLPEEVKRDEKGFVLTDENLMTNWEGVFAAGDVRANQLKQAITAAAEGALAAHLAEKFILG